MARSPLVVDITPLKRQPGTQRRFELSLEPLDGLALASAEVVADELHLDLILEVAGDELIATGRITVDWTGPCRRCLEDQEGSTEIELREIFQSRPVEGETYPLAENDVDLEPMVRETVLLNLPVAPLCSPGCAGPDPERFPAVVVETDTDADPAAHPGVDDDRPIDPRWAALGDITFD